MNKTFIGIILAVCVLGMALAMFSERLSREPEQPPQVAAANTQLPSMASTNGVPSDGVAMPQPQTMPQAPLTAPEREAMQEVEQRELAQAKEALAPPQIAREPEPAAPAPAPAAQPAEQPAQEPAPAEKAQTPPPVAEAARPADTPKPAEPEKPAPEKTVPEKKPAAPATPAKQPAQARPASADKAITNFVVFARDKGATIRLRGNSRIKYSSMTLENPNRVVVDLDGDWRFPANLPIPKNDMVSSVRTGKMGDKTRVVIDLKTKPRLSRMVESQNGNNLDVRVDR